MPKTHSCCNIRVTIPGGPPNQYNTTEFYNTLKSEYVNVVCETCKKYMMECIWYTENRFSFQGNGLYYFE